jgi:predicted RNase H-like HicB family nuclease
MTRSTIRASVRPSIEVVLEEEDGTWGVYVPGMPGIVSLGATREDAERNIVDAIESAIESIAEVEGPAIEADVARELAERQAK